MANEVDMISNDGSVDTAWDVVVIPQLITDIKGGRSLDTSDLGAGETVIRAGHVVLESTANRGQYKAMKTLSGGGYSTTATAGWEIVGVLYRTIKVNEPLAPIMTRGVVNVEAMVQSGAPDYADLDANIEDALPLIQFVEQHDKY